MAGGFFIRKPASESHAQTNEGDARNLPVY
jgi:hypothetical protein